MAAAQPAVSGAAIVAADMTGTTFCDSMGVRTLVMAHKRAAASSAELRVVVPSAGIRRIMAITRVDTVLRMYRAWTPRWLLTRDHAAPRTGKPDGLYMRKHDRS
jgi:anti-anti-sigma factor